MDGYIALLVFFVITNYAVACSTLIAALALAAILPASVATSSSVHVQRIPNDISLPITSCDLGK
jgi:hypothetical protein